MLSRAFRNRFLEVQMGEIPEAELATTHLTVASAADLLLFADAIECEQLAESATNLILANLPAVMETEGWARVAQNAKSLNELMGKMAVPNSPGLLRRRS